MKLAGGRVWGLCGRTGAAALCRHRQGVRNGGEPSGAFGAASDAYAWPSDTSGELQTRMFSSNLSRNSGSAARRSPSHVRRRVKNPRRMARFWRPMAARWRRKLPEVLGGRHFALLSRLGRFSSDLRVVRNHGRATRTRFMPPGSRSWSRNDVAARRLWGAVCLHDFVTRVRAAMLPLWNPRHTSHCDPHSPAMGTITS